MKSPVSKRRLAALFLGINLVWGVWCGRAQHPQVVVPPESVAVPEGGTAYLTVTATGELPLTFTWRRNFEFTNFYSATLYTTNCTLVYSNVTVDKACFFNLDVSNVHGYAGGKQAIVAVLGSGMETNGFALTINGLTNSTWKIECNTNFPAADWFVLTNISIPTFPARIKYTDLEATNGSRFYRVSAKVD